MADTDLPPIEQCDVGDKASLARFRDLTAKWWRWLRTDPHSAIWPQIYSMILEDMTFKTLAAAAEADQESALHSPILMRGLVTGYAATQGLAIRRLVDTTRGVISLRRLLQDMSNNCTSITRENYVSGAGLPYSFDRIMSEPSTAPIQEPSWPPSSEDADCLRSMQAHAAFDIISGKNWPQRDRKDHVPRKLIAGLLAKLDAPEIEAVVEWSNNRVAHAADQMSRPNLDVATLGVSFDTVTTAQKYLVNVAETVSVRFLRGPFHGELVPVYQFNQFARLDLAVRDPAAIKKAQQRWHELAKERNEWVKEVWSSVAL